VVVVVELMAVVVDVILVACVRLCTRTRLCSCVHVCVCARARARVCARTLLALLSPSPGEMCDGVVCTMALRVMCCALLCVVV
jgi:hypothetical protein